MPRADGRGRKGLVLKVSSNFLKELGEPLKGLSLKIEPAAKPLSLGQLMLGEQLNRSQVSVKRSAVSCNKLPQLARAHGHRIARPSRQHLTYDNVLLIVHSGATQKPRNFFSQRLTMLGEELPVDLSDGRLQVIQLTQHLGRYRR